MKQGMLSYMHVQNLMNSLWDIRIFLGLVPKESPCITKREVRNQYEYNCICWFYIYDSHVQPDDDFVLQAETRSWLFKNISTRNPRLTHVCFTPFCLYYSLTIYTTS